MKFNDDYDDSERACGNGWKNTCLDGKVKVLFIC